MVEEKGNDKCVSQSGREVSFTSQNIKRDYIRVDYNIRKKFIDLILNEQHTIIAAANELGIKYSNAKYIWKNYNLYKRIKILPKRIKVKHIQLINENHNGTLDRRELLETMEIKKEEEPSKINSNIIEIHQNENQLLKTTKKSLDINIGEVQINPKKLTRINIFLKGTLYKVSFDFKIYKKRILDE